ncbi:MAG: DUF4956 domain-containing protein [Gemmatimonadaceae bacterium]|nr:DUF4956 domain-containing protein [Gemmatimonadaceae bacterium]
MSDSSFQSNAATRLIVRAIVYYVVLVGGVAALWKWVPRNNAAIPASLEALMGNAEAVTAKGMPVVQLDEGSLAISVGVAILAAVLLSLPVAWVYQLTRAKRGYQQSIVQLLVVLPSIVAGIVLLVKYSVALAFSLAGIVAAVRFRNTLDDSKDAVYVFLATAIGLASAVNLPVATVMSIGFNMVSLALWFTDFGSAPVELDGRIAEKRLKRAKQLARTGTFVARIDDEVFRNMSREQLEGVAERAWKRANATNEEPAAMPEELRLRITTADQGNMRRAVEVRLQEYTKQWRVGVIEQTDGITVVEYHVQLRKKTTPEELLTLVRTAGSTFVTNVELS